MPRGRSLKPNEEKLSKIDLAFIQSKDCLEAKLKFNEAFSPKQWHALKTYFCCMVNEDDNTVTIKLNNSWKGLVMFFLSVAYMKHGNQLENTLLRQMKKYVKVQWGITNVSKHYYELVPNSMGPQETRIDDQIERIVAPPAWRPYYVKGNYSNENIKNSIDNFSVLLGIDAKQSVIKFDAVKQLPRDYKHRPAKPDDTKLLYCYFAGCTEGIAFVTSETMEELCEKGRAIKATYIFDPKQVADIVGVEDDPISPIPIYGYKITKESLSFLCGYFPYLEADFIREAKNSKNPTYVVFDRIHLGKWG